MAKAKCWVLLDDGKLRGVAVTRGFWKNLAKLKGYTVADGIVTYAAPKRRARKETPNG